MLKFSLLFLAILAGLFVFELTPPGQQYFVQPWTAGVAAVSVGAMRLFDPSVIAQGATVASSANGFAITILPGCNGVEAMIVLVAGMVAFPATWAQRGAGIAIGIVAIQALNLVRIVSLFYLGQWDRQWFDWAHLYLWQTLIMLDALFVWLLWMRAVRRREAATAAPAPA